MLVNVVCTGNVARSAALGILLQDHRPDLRVESSAVGLKAKEGRRCAKPMRALLASVGFGQEAEDHRSQLFAGMTPPDLVVCTARIHQKRLLDAGYEGELLVLDPPIPDPAFGGQPAYDRTWGMLLEARDYLGSRL